PRTGHDRLPRARSLQGLARHDAGRLSERRTGRNAGRLRPGRRPGVGGGQLRGPGPRPLAGPAALSRPRAHPEGPARRADARARPSPRPAARHGRDGGRRRPSVPHDPRRDHARRPVRPGGL
ncbi:hypothetical protein LTR94_031141, partial [Friedmanniomyces endolithicus]